MLTRRMQVQAIADCLAGIKQKYTPAEFDPPWAECYQAVINAIPGQANQDLIKVLSGNKNSQSIIELILGSIPGNGKESTPQFPSLKDISATLPPIQWLWPNWIPRGMLSLLGAVPGAGKSYLALDLARRIIHGEPWPDGTPHNLGGRNVIYIDAELVPQLLNDRANTWEIDTSKLFLMMPKRKSMIDLVKLEWQEELIEMCHYVDPALIVVDSIGSAQSRGENNVEDVREFLGFLSTVSADFATAVLMIHHLRKKQQLQMVLFENVTIDDFRGSGHIIAMSRCVMGLSVVRTTAEPNPNGPRRLEICKTNLARTPDPIGVEFEPRYPEGITLRYGEAPQTYHEPTQLETAAKWLLDILQEKPMRPEDLVDLGKQIGISRATLFRAREKLLEVVDTRGNRDPQNEWTLKKDGKDSL